MIGDPAERGMTWQQRLCSRCARVRRLAGIGQREMASSVGLRSSSSIAQFERAQAPVVRLALIAAYVDLAEKLGLPRAWLLGANDPRAAGRWDVGMLARAANLATAMQQFAADLGLSQRPRPTRAGMAMRRP